MTEKIYIVHGIFGGPREYVRMRRALKKEGFPSEVFTYKSRKETIVEVGRKLYERVLHENAEQVSFIVHSLGGLVLRAMLQYAKENSNFPTINKVIMIAVPNQGSVSGDFINNQPVLQWLFGINIRHLKQDSDSLAKKLPIDFPADVGIIAGARGKKRGYNPFMNGDNDGEIMPDETKLGTEKGFAIVKSNHVAILQNKETIRLTVNFMRTGSFYQK